MLGQWKEIDKDEEVKKAFDLVNEMRKEVEKYTKLLALVEEDRLKTVKMLFGGSYNKYLAFVEDSIKYLSDKKEYKNYRQSYKWLCECLEDITGYSVDVKQIMPTGLYRIGYVIAFRIEKRTFQLTIPVMERIGVDAFEDMDYGKLQIGEKKGSIIYLFASSYYPKEIKEAVKERLKTKGEG